MSIHSENFDNKLRSLPSPKKEKACMGLFEGNPKGSAHSGVGIRYWRISEWFKIAVIADSAD
jgi:hypothetical protein